MVSVAEPKHRATGEHCRVAQLWAGAKAPGGGERGLVETVLQAGQRRGTLRNTLRFRSGFQLGRHMESGGLTTHGRERPESQHVREVSKRLYYRRELWASSFFPCRVHEHRQQRELFMGKYGW